MNTSNPRERILEIKAGGAACNGVDLASLVAEWANCTEVEIADDGGVWISSPQTGHRLDDDKLVELADWIESQ